mgnify:CR=1 FL=1
MSLPPKKGKCQSCNAEALFLFPIAFTDETPYGEEMVVKWWCLECYRVVIEALDEDEEPECYGEYGSKSFLCLQCQYKEECKEETEDNEDKE